LPGLNRLRFLVRCHRQKAGEPWTMSCEKVVDIGSGAGLDSFIAAGQVGPGGQVTGVDMTAGMLARSRQSAAALGLAPVQFRDGLAEALPVPGGWADVVICNRVINLCAGKQAVFAQIYRVLRPGGRLQFADIANGRPIPAAALRDIDLWTGCIAGGLPRAGWHKMLENSGFTDVVTGPAVDTFGGSHGEGNARAFAVYGYAFMASKPDA
jgi:ubiquinone/menaquinone biosynthesis C-methylase UbiE